VKRSALSQDNPNFIKMYHGALEINVPRRAFVRGTAVMDEREAEAFRSTLSQRYPWLSQYALDDIMRGASEAMADHLERTKRMADRGRELLAQGRPEETLKLLEPHLESHEGDADSWYVLSEALFKLGRSEEGFKAMARARSCSGSASARPRPPR